MVVVAPCQDIPDDGAADIGLDRIHALKSGRIAAEGTPADVMPGATLKDVYGIAMDVTRHPTLGTPMAYVL